MTLDARGGWSATRGGVPPLRTTVCMLSSVHPSLDTRIFEKEAIGLAGAGFDVVVVAPGEAPESRQGVRFLGVPRARSRAARFIVTASRVFSLARRERAAIYHFHDPELLPFGILLRLTGAAVIYDVHEDVPAALVDKEWIPSIVRAAAAPLVDIGERALASLCSAVVAATPSIARRFAGHRCLRLVQNFPSRSERDDTSAHLPRESGLIAYVGGLSSVRGAREMVAALDKVEAPNAHLIAAGTFNSDSLKAECLNAANPKRVTFAGQLGRDGANGLMRRARVGLLLFHPRPNHVAAQPNKLFEYMAAGLPIVASDFPLWRTIIEEAECGILVDPCNVESIATAIDWLLLNPETASKMGASGRAAVREKFTWERECETLVQLYQELIGRTRRHSTRKG